LEIMPMRYYSVECEAPGGGFGPRARIKYDSANTYIKEVQYLDLIFDVWLGGELVQDVGCYCVSVSLCDYLSKNGIKGVSVRDMTVTPGEQVNDSHPGRVIPQFKELVLQRTLQGQQTSGWVLDSKSIPDADMFTGLGLPLFVSERAKELLVAYGVSGLDFEDATVK
jgi:hypothetical protein